MRVTGVLGETVLARARSDRDAYGRILQECESHALHLDIATQSSSERDIEGVHVAQIRIVIQSLDALIASFGA
jgi:hypothetical protein